MPIKINGATSGSTTITAPNTGSDETIELSTALAAKLNIAGGKILQIVRATDSTSRTTTSTSFVDVTGMSVTITPQKSDSAILVLTTANITCNSITTTLSSGEVQITDASNNAISGAEKFFVGIENTGTDRYIHEIANFVAWATPATTSAVTYKTRFKSVGANTTINFRNNIATGQMFAIEVSA